MGVLSTRRGAHHSGQSNAGRAVVSLFAAAGQHRSELPGRNDIVKMNTVVGQHIRRTPVVRVAAGDIGGVVATGTVPLTLKLEHLQCSGSFKARGAFANLLTRNVPPAGVLAASGGNHGVGVAYAAARLGVPAHIFVPTVSAAEKVERIRKLGANLVIAGDRYSDALAVADAFAAESGALSIHAFDQYETIAGQGTLAVELAEQAPELSTVLVPVGGGGLIAGIAAFFGDSVRVVGVEPTGAPTLTRARAHGEPVDAPTDGIAADALAPRQVGGLTFSIAETYVDDVVLVDDDGIADAQRILWERLRIIAEPAGAVGIAALRTGAYRPGPNEHVGVVITGANTAATT
ncbi:MAG TPA: serine/threonine dehydratase [Mycobacterium sp.]|nr:serine/threonine dehydratase [Mycobacterium sp.]